MDNGDLIEYGGRWWVYEPDFSPEFANATLLAPAGGDLWDALWGLPHGDWISTADAVIDLDCAIVTVKKAKGGAKCKFHYISCSLEDTTPIEAAIQKYKALRQFIAAKAVQE